MIDPLISLAFSLYSNKGAYALLLGSGVSRGSGIPTGWEVVQDLIRKVAALEGENCEPQPDSWFRQRHGSEPDYSKLLDSLARTPTERQQILRAYFEPTEDERSQGLKSSTAAHRAIAQLASKGILRVILTTNFDRLMEKALEEVGVSPTVISTPDQVAGAVPLALSGVTLIKLHGDYLDTRIKNTESELAHYDPSLSALLDRVVDEYGLIVSGWSADWDIALRAGIERCKSRRFTTYWTTRSPLVGQASRLAEHRKAEVVTIRDADHFFAGLLEKVRALDDLGAPHPLSAKMATATVKRYLVDASARIKLQDLVYEESERLNSELGLDKFPTNEVRGTDEEIARRARKYEALVETLLEILITGCYWGEPEHADIWWKPPERISNQPPPTGAFNERIDALRTYPGLVLLYGGGIAALAAQKYAAFSTLMLRPRYLDRYKNQKKPLITEVGGGAVSFSEQAGRKMPILLNAHLHNLLRPRFARLVPDDDDFQIIFDRCEYLFGLLRIELSNGIAFWGGNYCFRFHPVQKIQDVIDSELSASGGDCPYLKAGLFGGNVTKMRELMLKLATAQQGMRG